jgi:Flp pilus assembly protein TadD
MQKLSRWLTVILLVLSLAPGVPAQPRPLAEDVFTPLALGYDLLRQGKFEAAEQQFRTALSRDPQNPFALNNLAVLKERQGRRQEALAYLEEAARSAGEYREKVEEACFVGGLCAAVKPLQVVGQESSLAAVVADNLKKLKDKLATLPRPPEPSTPPKMK